MTNTNSSKANDSNPLTQAAIALENDFNEINRLSKSLHELTSKPIHDLKQAKKLLLKFSETGLRVGEEIQSLAKALDEGRQRAEASATIVAEAANIVRKIEDDRNSIFNRFQALAQKVQEISHSLTPFARVSESETIDRESLRDRLPSLDKQLEAFILEAADLKNEAQNKRFNDIGKDAEAMEKSLKATRQKLQNLAENLFK